MLTGAHAIIYSTNADADRAFLRDVLSLPNVDVGGGWLIFGLPPSEVAVHPGERNDRHELYLICDDVEAFIASMTSRGVSCSTVQDQGWGLLTEIALPGGGKLGVYEPRHARPESASKPSKSSKKREAKAPKKRDEAKPSKKRDEANKKADKKASSKQTKSSKKAEKAKKKADKKAEKAKKKTAKPQ